MTEERKKRIHQIMMITTIILIPVIIGILIVTYQIEGEQNMPFELTNITLVSNAEGKEKEVEGYQWAMDLVQNNDFYLKFEKNKEYNKTESIDYIRLENIQITRKPQIGTIRFYRPSSEKTHIYEYKEEYYIQDNRIEYIGNEQTDAKNLEISNQGGMVLFRCANEEVGQIQSNDEEISHDGKMLKEANIDLESLQGTIAFSIIIHTKSDVTYKADVQMDLPAGNILEEGTSYIEKTDLSDIIFKRI